MSELDQAVLQAFALFAQRYGKRWDIPAEAATGWAASLELDGATPAEVLTAAKTWSDSNKWPPCFADLRQAIPRFCRCGKCIACNRRAHARATAACNAGCQGSEDFGPKLATDSVLKQLGELATHGTPKLTSGNATRGLAP